LALPPAADEEDADRRQAAFFAKGASATLCDCVEIQIAGPSLRVRDELREAQVDRIAHTHGILSPQKWSRYLGLDYDQEQKNLAEHGSRRE
jgi:hypothetical protein